MANVKDVVIGGVLPFNCDNYDGMCRVLGQLNSPSSGLKMCWGAEAPPKPSSHGGRTTMYYFEIRGQEAVAESYLQVVLQSIVNCGGEVTQVRVRDVENNYAQLPMSIPKPQPGAFVFSVPVMVTEKIDRDDASMYLLHFLKPAIVAGLDNTGPPDKIKSAKVDNSKGWVRPA